MNNKKGSMMMQAMDAMWRRMPAGPMASALRQVTPVILGYLPVGFAYGVLAQKAGLSVLNTVLMSVFVYAGSAQLIAVAMFAAGAAPLAVIITTFIVNLRHMLMSAALAPHLKNMRPMEVAAMTAELTDESFALHATRFARGENDKAETFGINTIAHISWITGSVLGILASGLIGDVRPLGLDFALPAMFLVLLVWQIHNRHHMYAAVAAAMLSVGLYLSGCEQWNVILATLIAASLGLVLGRSGEAS